MTLSPRRWQQIKEVLDAALERPPPEREAFLREACGQDSSLREEVESLLASAPLGEGLEEAPFEDAGALFDGTDEQDEQEPGWDGPRPGRRIGAYRIVEELGRGGMGAVYRAVRDDDEFQQQVATWWPARSASTSPPLRAWWWTSWRSERGGPTHPGCSLRTPSARHATLRLPG